jgi:hypothetical protein
MVPLRRCRELVGQECNLSDQELEELRDQLYAFAHCTLDCFVQSTGAGRRTPRRRASAAMRKVFAGARPGRPEEMIAAREFDGGRTRGTVRQVTPRKRGRRR